MSKRKTVRKQSRGCQERGGLPRSAWSRAAEVEPGEGGRGSDMSLPEAPIHFVTFLFLCIPIH